MPAERRIIATLLRKGQPVWTRRYSRIANAEKRAVELAMTDPTVQPGDVIEVSHAHSGRQLGTVKIKVAALSCWWVWDD